MKQKRPESLQSKINESVRFIRTKSSYKPKIAIILGSGLGDFTNAITQSVVIETNTIPHYPNITVEGHRGKIVFGKVGSKTILAFQGRIHYYETGNLETVLYPIRVAQALGVQTLILTNAAGGVNKTFQAGDLMMITDQINLTFQNPLKNNEPARLSRRVGTGGHRVSSIALYDKKICNIIIKVAQEKSIDIKRGIYCGVKGPSYETAAEIEMIRRIGGDAVGMSTVNEVSLAKALGMRVAGISCITNMATGISTERLSHAEVTVEANKVKEKFSDLMSGVIKNIG